jgi:putative Mg2+ transporter-C (MgtC) family protein
MRTILDELLFLISANHESVLRLMLAAALGGIIGLEREASGKPAGFRTNLLICLGAALVTELSAFVASASEPPGDPGRIAAQIVSGIGFLGAGTIMQARGGVYGLTTAATLWVVATIGMAVGAGAYLHASVATLLVMLALMILGRVDDHLVPRRPTDRTVRVVLDPRPDLVKAVEQYLLEAGYQVRSVDVTRDADTFVASFGMRGAAGDYDTALRALLANAGVRQVSLD